MKVVLTGGGTLGHITPILAVAHELKRRNPDVHIVYIGERGGQFAAITRDHEAIDEVHTIFAGKFRRYHGESWLRRLLDVKTNLLNIRDILYFGLGMVQSWFLLGRLHPDAILLKGGFVGVPVGLSAAARKLPFVTHDSDALPGLANRLVSKWARIHAVALPPEEYAYRKASTMQVGVLVEPNFHAITETEQGSYKRQIGIPERAMLLLITGGSTGAVRLNEAVVKIIHALLEDYSGLHVVHQVGKGKMGVYGGYRHERLQVMELMRPMYVYTGAADLIVTRGGANAIAEFGVQHKAIIVVPSMYLTGGHQVKNALRLEQQHAAVVIQESPAGLDELALEAAIRHLLSDQSERKALAAHLGELTISDAASRLATLLLDIGGKQVQ